jgi:hypothetical protein
VFEILKARKEGKVFCAQAGGKGPCVDFASTVGLAAGETIFPPLTFTSRVFAIDSVATVGETRSCVKAVVDRGTGSEMKTLYYELGC